MWICSTVPEFIGPDDKAKRGEMHCDEHVLSATIGLRHGKKTPDITQRMPIEDDPDKQQDARVLDGGLAITLHSVNLSMLRARQHLICFDGVNPRILIVVDS